MTKEEILQTFSDINYAYNDSSKYDTLKRMLDELTEPCEDAISRVEARKRIIECVIDKASEGFDAGIACYNNGLFYASDIISDLPSVTPKQKMGRWIAVENEDMNTTGYFCSECDLPLETEERTLFCPNCGAKMEERSEKE